MPRTSAAWLTLTVVFVLSCSIVVATAFSSIYRLVVWDCVESLEA